MRPHGKSISAMSIKTICIQTLQENRSFRKRFKSQPRFNFCPEQCGGALVKPTIEEGKKDLKVDKWSSMKFFTVEKSIARKLKSQQID